MFREAVLTRTDGGDSRPKRLPTRRLDASNAAAAARFHGFPERLQTVVTEALCWAHGQRKFFELARHRGEHGVRNARAADLPGGASGGQADRRPVQHRALGQWPVHGVPPRGALRVERAAPRQA